MQITANLLKRENAVRSIDTLQNGPSMKTLVNIWLSKFKSSSGGFIACAEERFFACTRLSCDLSVHSLATGWRLLLHTRDKGENAEGNYGWLTLRLSLPQEQQQQQKKTIYKKTKHVFFGGKWCRWLCGAIQNLYTGTYETFNIAPFIVKPHFVTYLFSMSFFPHFTHKRRSVWSL